MIEILSYLHIAVAAVFFGLTLEIFFTAMSSFFDGFQAGDENLKGDVSVWMTLVYGGFLPALYIPMLYLTKDVFHIPFYFRYFIWAISITGVEALSGWIFDRGFYYLSKGKLSVRPWNYSGHSDSLLNGYTRWKYLPLWGVAGLILESYMFTVTHSSDYVVKIFLEFVRGYF